MGERAESRTSDAIVASRSSLWVGNIAEHQIGSAQPAQYTLASVVNRPSRGPVRAR